MPVRLTSRESLHILNLAEIWAARTGHEVRLVSANDHVHSRGSAHYHGLAVDFHSTHPDGLAATLRRAGYRVLWRVPGHYSHVHAEEPRRGRSPGRSAAAQALVALGSGSNLTARMQ